MFSFAFEPVAVGFGCGRSDPSVFTVGRNSGALVFVLSLSIYFFGGLATELLEIVSQRLQLRDCEVEAAAMGRARSAARLF